MNIARILPPFVIDIAKRVLGKPGFYGDYTSFEEAASVSTGYDSQEIAQAVATKPRIGDPTRNAQTRTAFERTGAAGLRVLDVGGANGHAYDVVRDLVLEWTVLETASVVAVHRARGALRFVTDAPGRFDVIHMSGVLQYLPEPYTVLAQYGRRAPFLIVNRVPLYTRDRLTVQRIPGASFPAWFFDSQRFWRAVHDIGTPMLQWPVPQDNPLLDGRRVPFGGVLIASRT